MRAIYFTDLGACDHAEHNSPKKRRHMQDYALRRLCEKHKSGPRWERSPSCWSTHLWRHDTMLRPPGAPLENDSILDSSLHMHCQQMRDTIASPRGSRETILRFPPILSGVDPRRLFLVAWLWNLVLYSQVSEAHKVMRKSPQ